MSAKKRVLAAHILGSAGWEMLERRADIEALPFANTIPQEEFRALLRSMERVDGVILGLTRFGEAERAEARGLKVVSRIGVGYDAVDVPALAAHGVPVMVAGTANASSVAEQTLHFMLALAKRGAGLDALVRAGRWGDRMEHLPADLSGKRVLLVGFGRIGSRVARRCLAMEMDIWVHDPYVSPELIRRSGCVPAADLDEALGAADIVSLHCPKTPLTLGMFGADRLAVMKPGAVLINTARGGIVDEAALYQALVRRRLAAAALDVFAPEPPAAANPLLALPNVLVSPHVAGVTVESVQRMAVQAVGNLLSVFDGEPAWGNVIDAQALAMPAPA